LRFREELRGLVNHHLDILAFKAMDLLVWMYLVLENINEKILSYYLSTVTVISGFSVI
jgi:hypothetical protein